MDSATASDQLTLDSIEQVHLNSHRRLAMLSACLVVLPVAWYVRTDLALYAGDCLDTHYPESAFMKARSPRGSESDD